MTAVNLTGPSYTKLLKTPDHIIVFNQQLCYSQKN